MTDKRKDTLVPTETQPAPNLSTERPRANDDSDNPVKPTETQPAPNLSTEHAPQGSARRPTAQLDR